MKESYSEYRNRTVYGQETSKRYAERKRSHTAEFDLVDAAMERIPADTKLIDLPCGGGRMSLHLAKQGYDVISADRSEHMISITKEIMQEADFPGHVQIEDIENLSMADRSIDGVFCFRLFQHFPNKDIRAKAVSEMCRIADQYVIMSYFNSRCLNIVRRRVRDRLKGKLYKKYGTSLSQVKGYFADNGFQFIEDFAEPRPLLRPLHIAVFKRTI